MTKPSLISRLMTVAVSAMLMATTTPTLPASAAVGSNFNAGRIIDNEVFYNKNTMSVQDIQNWLNDMLDGTLGNGATKACDTNGTKPISSGSSQTRAQWAAANGYPAPPYVCVRDYMENPATLDNNLDGSVSGGISAAQIIWNESQTYNINPQVLLVMIQKESVGGMLTDDWPFPSQYNTILGYACPDGQPCASEYYGFYNQMHNAARQFRLYANNPNNYNYIPNQNNNILYHPSNPCGSQTVFIQNQATAGLYNYTPYVPNTAALNNLYGTGDSCSSYGNRNFWRFFTDWFGSTYWTGGETNIDWSFENLDGGSGGVSGSSTGSVGKFPKMIEFNSALHSFYYDATLGDLRHGWADNAGWHFESLDGNNTTGGRISANVGETPSVIIHGGAIHVFYHDATNGDLRHTWSTNPSATAWAFETLDGASDGVPGTKNARVGLWPSAAVYNTTLQLFYYDYQNGRLRHAWNNGSWHFEDLDGGPNSVGRWSANVGDTSAVGVYPGNNSLQVYYYDSTYGNLRHAWADNAGWHFEHLDGTVHGVSRKDNNVGRNPTLTTYNTSLQLFYYDGTAGNLRHTWVSPGQPWKFEDLDGDPASVGKENANTGITPHSLVYQNMLYVFYYNNDTHALRHAYSNNTGWHFGTLDGSIYSSSFRNSNAGMYPVAIPYPASNPELQMLYYDSTTSSLRHAWGPLEP